MDMPPSLNLIPKISDEEISEMLQKITPLMIVDGKWGDALYQIDGIENVATRDFAFLWDAKPKGREHVFHFSRTFITYHTWAYYGFFKPTLAEVYAQIRKLDNWESFDFFALKSDMQPSMIIDEYHWCFCKLFTKNDLLREDQVFH